MPGGLAVSDSVAIYVRNRLVAGMGRCGGRMSVAGQGVVAEDSPDTIDGHHDGETLVAMIENLPADERAKILGMERWFIGGTGRQYGELYCEVLFRVLTGKRKCPRNVSLVKFVVEAMRSIADHDRQARSRVLALDETYVVPTTDGMASEILPAVADDPEQALLTEVEIDETGEVIDRIKAALADDEQCQLMLLGWSEELRGKDLRELVGADQSRIDYLGKKIRRVAAKLYPDRMTR